MNRFIRRQFEQVTIIALLLVGQVRSASASPIRGDVEIDPAAYALSGHSVHVGLAYDRLRLDLGSFGLEVPTFVHGADGFDVSFDGFGIKLQLFRDAVQAGWFLGLETAVVRVLAQRKEEDLAVRDTQLNAGAQLGYRFQLPNGLYVTPWIGVGRVFGARDVTLAGQTYAPSSLSVFPTVHFGYRFPHQP